MKCAKHWNKDLCLVSDKPAGQFILLHQTRSSSWVACLRPAAVNVHFLEIIEKQNPITYSPLQVFGLSLGRRQSSEKVAPSSDKKPTSVKSIKLSQTHIQSETNICGMKFDMKISLFHFKNTKFCYANTAPQEIVNIKITASFSLQSQYSWIIQKDNLKWNTRRKNTDITYIPEIFHILPLFLPASD